MYSKPNCCIGSIAPILDYVKGSKSLVIVQDASVPEDYYIQEAFTTYLITPEERRTIEKFCTRAFGPMTFAAFHK